MCLCLTGGQRNWVQVLCNSGMAVQLALLYILDSGCGERPIDFHDDYRASWLALGVIGQHKNTNTSLIMCSLIVSEDSGFAVGIVIFPSYYLPVIALIKMCITSLTTRD